MTKCNGLDCEEPAIWRSWTRWGWVNECGVHADRNLATYSDFEGFERHRIRPVKKKEDGQK